MFQSSIYSEQTKTFSFYQVVPDDRLYDPKCSSREHVFPPQSQSCCCSKYNNLRELMSNTRTGRK